MRRPPPPIWLGFLASALALGADFPTFKALEIDADVGDVCYAVTLADVDGDGKPDVVAAATDAVVWYRNPTWAGADIIRKATEADNVCIQGRDVDGDGRVDFALGAGWRPTDTKDHGTLQVLTRTGSPGADAWRVVPLGSEPTLHRVRWGDVLGSKRPQLVVAPLQGRGTEGPDWGEGAGVPDPGPDRPEPTRSGALARRGGRRLAPHRPQPPARRLRRRPAATRSSSPPAKGIFVLEPGPDGRWSRAKLGEGDQDPATDRGGERGQARPPPGGKRFVATIEPWHGSQFVVYTARTSRAAALGPGRGRRADRLGPCRLVRRPRRRRRRRGDRRPARPEQGGPRRPARGPGVFAYEATGEPRPRFRRHLDRRRRGRDRGPRGRRPRRRRPARDRSPAAGPRTTSGSTGTIAPR